MKYCKRCGAELGDGALLCAQCGRQVTGDEGEVPRDPWEEKLHRPEKETPAREEPEKPRKGRISTEELLLEQVLDEEANGTHEKLRKMKWLAGALGILVLILAALAAFLLLRPGEDTTARVFLGSSCYLNGNLYSGSGDWVSLGSDGKAELFLLGKGEKGTYKEKNGSITISVQGKQYEGSLTGGVLELDQGDVRFTLALEGMETCETPIEPKLKGLTRWEGDYYGWWQVNEAWGDWEDSRGDRRDVCGRIWLEEEGLGRLELWDTRCRADQLIAAADLQITRGMTDLGCLQNGEGRFFDFPLQSGDWVIDPAREPYKSLPGILMLTGSFHEGSSGFSYQVFLKPWGSDWKDVKELTAPVLPLEDRLPELYKDWYLPLVQQGASMPESFYGVETEK